MSQASSKTEFLVRYNINEATARILWKECQHLQNRTTEEVLSIQTLDHHRIWISYNPLDQYADLVCTKTVDSVFRTLWLAIQSVIIQRYSLIHLHFLQARDAKLA